MHHRLLTHLAPGWLAWSRDTRPRLGSLSAWSHGASGTSVRLHGAGALFVKPATLAVDQSAEISLAGIGALLCILMW